MIDIAAWMDDFLQALKDTFGERVWFVGLQGSYARGEATDKSDIDPVVILDALTPSDIQTYGAMLYTLPHRELVCGFLSGKTELMRWDTADLFQFYHDMDPILGSLDELLPLLEEQAVTRAVKMAVCNIYHGCVRNMLHGKREKTLRGLYKSASFAVQAICFLETGSYIRHQKDLLAMVSPEEKVIVETFLHLKNGGAVKFEAMSEVLFGWCQKWITKIR